MAQDLPILYSNRRCPYAMRARMALRYSGIAVEIREIALKDKPGSMLQVSPKGTVPVLVIGATVIDESLDIMYWALAQHDPDHWLPREESRRAEVETLIAVNDYEFKAALDRYKYATRFPEQPAETYRGQGEVFLQTLESRLQAQPWLCGQQRTLADMAIFPFVRQFAMVDMAWFEHSSYAAVNAWLAALKESDLFQTVMKKYPTWMEAAT